MAVVAVGLAANIATDWYSKYCVISNFGSLGETPIPFLSLEAQYYSLLQPFFIHMKLLTYYLASFIFLQYPLHMFCYSSMLLPISMMFHGERGKRNRRTLSNRMSQKTKSRVLVLVRPIAVDFFASWGWMAVIAVLVKLFLNSWLFPHPNRRLFTRKLS